MQNPANKISIRAPREGSDRYSLHSSKLVKISIRAPREGSDCKALSRALWIIYFYPRSPRGERQDPNKRLIIRSDISIRAPREGSDQGLADSIPTIIEFLSALPARGATPTSGGWATTPTNFYPRSPRGERLWAPTAYPQGWEISIRAPREGSDRPPSRPPGSEAPISIRAPREGSDRKPYDA